METDLFEQIRNDLSRLLCSGEEECQKHTNSLKATILQFPVARNFLLGIFLKNMSEKQSRMSNVIAALNILVTETSHAKQLFKNYETEDICRTTLELMENAPRSGASRWISRMLEVIVVDPTVSNEFWDEYGRLFLKWIEHAQCSRKDLQCLYIFLESITSNGSLSHSAREVVDFIVSSCRRQVEVSSNSEVENPVYIRNTQFSSLSSVVVRRLHVECAVEAVDSDIKINDLVEFVVKEMKGSDTNMAWSDVLCWIDKFLELTAPDPDTLDKYVSDHIVLQGVYRQYPELIVHFLSSLVWKTWNERLIQQRSGALDTKRTGSTKLEIASGDIKLLDLHLRKKCSHVYKLFTAVIRVPDRNSSAENLRIMTAFNASRLIMDHALSNSSKSSVDAFFTTLLRYSGVAENTGANATSLWPLFIWISSWCEIGPNDCAWQTVLKSTRASSSQDDSALWVHFGISLWVLVCRSVKKGSQFLTDSLRREESISRAMSVLRSLNISIPVLVNMATQQYTESGAENEIMDLLSYLSTSISDSSSSWSKKQLGLEYDVLQSFLDTAPRVWLSLMQAIIRENGVYDTFSKILVAAVKSHLKSSHQAVDDYKEALIRIGNIDTELNLEKKRGAVELDRDVMEALRAKDNDCSSYMDALNNETLMMKLRQAVKMNHPFNVKIELLGAFSTSMTLLARDGRTDSIDFMPIPVALKEAVAEKKINLLVLDMHVRRYLMEYGVDKIPNVCALFDLLVESSQNGYEDSPCSLLAKVSGAIPIPFAIDRLIHYMNIDDSGRTAGILNFILDVRTSVAFQNYITSDCYSLHRLFEICGEQSHGVVTRCLISAFGTCNDQSERTEALYEFICSHPLTCASDDSGMKQSLMLRLSKVTEGMEMDSGDLLLAIMRDGCNDKFTIFKWILWESLCISTLTLANKQESILEKHYASFFQVCGQNFRSQFWKCILATCLVVVSKLNDDPPKLLRILDRCGFYQLFLASRSGSLDVWDLVKKSVLIDGKDHVYLRGWAHFVRSSDFLLDISSRFADESMFLTCELVDFLYASGAAEHEYGKVVMTEVFCCSIYAHVIANVELSDGLKRLQSLCGRYWVSPIIQQRLPKFALSDTRGIISELCLGPEIESNHKDKMYRSPLKRTPRSQEYHMEFSFSPKKVRRSLPQLKESVQTAVREVEVIMEDEDRMELSSVEETEMHKSPVPRDDDEIEDFSLGRLDYEEDELMDTDAGNMHSSTHDDDLMLM